MKFGELKVLGGLFICSSAVFVGYKISSQLHDYDHVSLSEVTVVEEDIAISQ